MTKTFTLSFRQDRFLTIAEVEKLAGTATYEAMLKNRLLLDVPDEDWNNDIWRTLKQWLKDNCTGLYHIGGKSVLMIMCAEHTDIVKLKMFFDGKEIEV